MLTASLNKKGAKNRISAPARWKSACWLIIGLAMVGVPTCLDSWSHVAAHFSEQQLHSAMKSTDKLHINSTIASTWLDATTKTTPRCLPSLHTRVPIIGIQCPENSHYCYDDSGQLHWEPLNRCRLVPPQTLWMICSGSIVKGAGMGIVFWTKLSSEPNVWMDNAVSTFVVSQSAASVGLLVYKAWSMSGFDSWWEHFQCWGLILSCAPWTQNIVLYYWKVSFDSPLLPNMEEFEATITPAKERSLAKKRKVAGDVLLGTMLAFAIFNGCFAITNLIPAMICFFWVGLPLVGCGFGSWECLLGCARARTRARASSGCLRGLSTDNEKFEFKINITPMVAIPMAAAYDICVQWLAATSVYWYGGLSYWCAAWTASSERRSDIYYDTFVAMVICHVTWASVLINQLIP